VRKAKCELIWRFVLFDYLRAAEVISVVHCVVKKFAAKKGTTAYPL